MANRYGICALLCLLVGVLAPWVAASDDQWNIRLNLYGGGVGGTSSDIDNMMGVRLGATDGYDGALDAKKPPPPLAPYVLLYWNRPAWDEQARYKDDWRSSIPEGECKTWQDLRAKSSITGPKSLAWLAAIGGSAWQVPDDYNVTLYDEGTAPNPTGGAPLNMLTNSNYGFGYAVGETRHFHVRVAHGTTLPPVITDCPDDITVSNDPGRCEATVSVGTTAAAPICDSAATITGTRSDGKPLTAAYPVGVTTITWTACDPVVPSNCSSCVQQVAVNDAEPPVITCVNQTVSADGGCTAACPVVATAPDNCGIASLSQSPAAGTTLLLGDTAVVASATDTAGSTAVCTATVTVVDTTPPAITCVDKTVSAGGGATAPCPAVATATDNCPGAVTVAQSPAVGTPLPVGVHVVTATAVDAAGNTSTCTATVTVTYTVIMVLPGNCWHLFSLPCEPVDPDPEHVFPPGTPLEGNLTRYWEGGYIAYYSFEPPRSEFGPMHAGVGYWIYALHSIVLSYEGVCSATAEELNLPYAGWYMIGNHQQGDVPVAACTVRDNGTGDTLPFEQAWLSGWVGDPLFAYSCWPGLSYVTVGVDFFDEDSYLREYKGYWFYTMQPDQTLIVPLP